LRFGPGHRICSTVSDDWPHATPDKTVPKSTATHILWVEFRSRRIVSGRISGRGGRDSDKGSSPPDIMELGGLILARGRGNEEGGASGETRGPIS
jgi:hypothetical protein